MVRGGDDYGIDILITQEFVVIEVRADVSSARVANFIAAGLIDVTRRDQLAVARFVQGLQQLARSAAASNESNANSVVGAEYPRCRKRGKAACH